MPRSNSRPRWKCPLHGFSILRSGGKCPRCGDTRGGLEKAILIATVLADEPDPIAEQLKDRRDYRNALIHRIEHAHHKERFVRKLAAVEASISALRRRAA